MSNKLVLSLVALSASLAFAAPKAPPREVFSIDSKLKAPVAGMSTSDFTLMTNGRWSYVEIIDGKVTKRGAGTLSHADVVKIRAALAPAKWTFTLARLRCMAEALTYNEVSFAGAVVWTDQLCSGKILDADSRRRLDQVMTIVNPLIASVK